MPIKNCSTCGHRFEQFCLLSGEYFTSERRKLNKCNLYFSGWIPSVDQEKENTVSNSSSEIKV